MPSPVRAFLDANVLYSNQLRNLLLQLAQNDVFIAKWSIEVEREWLRNVEPAIRTHIVARTLPLMREYFPSALTTAPMSDRVIGQTDAKDRHVASAAAELAPSVLVTFNLGHFDAVALAALGVKVQSPDDFLTARFDEAPAFVLAATREAAANLTRTAPSWQDYLAILDAQPVPTFVARLRALDSQSA